MPPWPLVLGSDAVTLEPAATNGEFLWSVKASTAMTMTIAASRASMAPSPHRVLALASQHARDSK
jgi:hypothetical protein